LDLISLKDLKKVQIKCNKHKEENILFVCYDCNKMSVCIDCSSVDVHKGHDIRNIKKAYIDI